MKAASVCMYACVCVCVFVCVCVCARTTCLEENQDFSSHFRIFLS